MGMGGGGAYRQAYGPCNQAYEQAGNMGAMNMLYNFENIDYLVTIFTEAQAILTVRMSSGPRADGP
jgi:hypothetical protein